MTPDTKVLGNEGESIVAAKMQKNGFTILARNFRTAIGEIDIIAQRGNTLAFVEVKTRQHMHFDVSEVITPTKQRKMVMVAKAFLSRYTNPEIVCRFDVAIIEHQQGSTSITYIPNAFYGDE